MNIVYTNILLVTMAIVIIGEINAATAEEAASSTEAAFFTCDDGREVIADELMCNGVVDCNDESDESEEKCKDVTCDENAFRCKYGACVGKQALCDKVNDCMDKSDETDSSCNEEK